VEGTVADRYCGNCGNALSEDDRFCRNCGTPVHEAAVVPTPEADVEAPSLPQQDAEDPPPQTERVEPPPASRPNILIVALKAALRVYMRLTLAGKVLLVLAVLGGAGVLTKPYGDAAVGAVAVLVVLPMLVGILILEGVSYFSRGQRSSPTGPNVRPVHSRTIPQDVKVAVAVRDQGRCRICSSTQDLQYDHIIPYSHGGRSADVDNIQLLCGYHNRLKSNRYVR
jgi:hypothetical protein